MEGRPRLASRGSNKRQPPAALDFQRRELDEFPTVCGPWLVDRTNAECSCILYVVADVDIEAAIDIQPTAVKYSRWRTTPEERRHDLGTWYASRRYEPSFSHALLVLSCCFRASLRPWACVECISICLSCSGCLLVVCSGVF